MSEYMDRCAALLGWFESQDISHKDGMEVMLGIVGACIAAQAMSKEGYDFSLLVEVLADCQRNLALCSMKSLTLMLEQCSRTSSH